MAPSSDPGREYALREFYEKIGELKDLPVPNPHIVRLMQDLRNEDVEWTSLINDIERDQSLVAKLLKLVNSGYFGLRSTVDSVAAAVKLLGLAQVRQAVFSATVMEVFKPEEKEEWDHAYSSFILMNTMMKSCNIPAASNLPLTMLLHDIGKVALRRFAPKKYDMAVFQASNEDIPVEKAERQLLKVDHAEVGGWLLEKWMMTDDIIKPISYHHTTGIPEEYVLESALVQFVDWVDLAARGHTNWTPPSEELMKEAGFDDLYEDYWIDHQATQIRELEEEGLTGHKAEIGSTKTTKISRSGVRRFRSR